MPNEEIFKNALDKLVLYLINIPRITPKDIIGPMFLAETISHEQYVRNFLIKIKIPQLATPKGLQWLKKEIEKEPEIKPE